MTIIISVSVIRNQVLPSKIPNAAPAFGGIRLKFIRPGMTLIT